MFGCFHDRRKERQLYEKSTREKLDAAERFKKEGTLESLWALRIIIFFVKGINSFKRRNIQKRI